MSPLFDLFWKLYHWLLRLVDPTHPISLALRAEQALAQQRWGLAFDLSNAALKKREDLGPAYFMRGVARLHLDDYRGAVHDLNRFVALTEEPPPAVYYWRGRLHAQQAEWAMALADFDRVLDATPDDPELHYWRAYVYWRREEWEKMRGALERLEALSPDNPLSWELRAHLLFHDGAFDEAEVLYSRAMDVSGDTPDLRYNRSLTRRYLGHYEPAKEDLQAILEMEPNRLWVHLELNDYALEAGEYQDALQHARAAVALDQDSFEARLSEAATLVAMGENEQARERLQAMRMEFAGQPLVEQLYGDLLASEGEAEAAIECYRRVLELEPDNHVVRLKLAGELISLQRYEEAQQAIEQVLEMEPENVDAYATRADLYRYNNEPDAMRADLDHLLTLDPQNAWALAFRAAHSQWLGDLKDAQANYDAALVADSHQAWIWAFRGQFHLRSGQLAAGRDDFQRAITLDPEDPWIRRQWAYLLSESGHHDKAAEVLDCLVADYPDDGFARLARCELHLLMEQWDAAEAQLEAIVEAEHELSWLAHAALAVFSEGDDKRRHLALADEQRPAPVFWGITPATVLAQQALVAWQREDTVAAETLLRQAKAQREPGERVWRGLCPLLKRLDAQPLLEQLENQDCTAEHDED
ncbi:MAG: tetratricopeptide repeat protein [Chloroflexota bacterium]|nr:tetratricopeptide repeat protein [Chloroflexota bacterium]